MKINPVKRRAGRSTAMPEYGITFTAAEEARINDIAKRLFAALDYDSLIVLRDALGAQILRLEDAVEWTCGETEVTRKAAFEEAVIHYRAVYVAIARL